MEEIEKLAKMSGKLFIFASTVAKWITENETLVKSRLRDALNLKHTPDKSATEGVDDLYNIVVNKAIAPRGKVSLQEREKLLKILHTVVTVTHPVSCKVIAQLSGGKPHKFNHLSLIWDLFCIQQSQVKPFILSMHHYQTIYSRWREQTVSIVIENSIMAF